MAPYSPTNHSTTKQMTAVYYDSNQLRQFGLH